MATDLIHFLNANSIGFYVLSHYKRIFKQEMHKSSYFI